MSVSNEDRATVERIIEEAKTITEEAYGGTYLDAYKFLFGVHTKAAALAIMTEIEHVTRQRIEAAREAGLKPDPDGALALTCVELGVAVERARRRGDS